MIDFVGGPFTVQGLEMVLRILNETGDVRVRNVKPGSVSLLELGAVLAQRAKDKS